jgi:hypothetical protein
MKGDGQNRYSMSARDIHCHLDGKPQLWGEKDEASLWNKEGRV